MKGISLTRVAQIALFTHTHTKRTPLQWRSGVLAQSQGHGSHTANPNWHILYPLTSSLPLPHPPTQVIDWFAERKMNVYSVSCGSALLYNNIFPKHKERLNKKMSELVSGFAC